MSVETSRRYRRTEYLNALEMGKRMLRRTPELLLQDKLHWRSSKYGIKVEGKWPKIIKES